MIKNYFKTAFRVFRKNPLFTFINIAGLTIAFASLILILVFIVQEFSFDKFNKNADRIVRVTMEYNSGGTINKIATTGTKPGPEFARRFPEVASYVRTFLTSDILKIDDQLFEEKKFLFADPGFFQMFTFPIIKGNPETALNAHDKVVITESAAKKYFGKEDPINKVITSDGKDLIISAVCKTPPLNSQIHFDFVSPFLSLNDNLKTETWWTANWITYLMLKNPQDIPVLQRQINSYMNSKEVRDDVGMEGNDYLAFHLEPLTSVHLYSSLPGFEPNGSIRFVYMIGVIALLILIISFANYTNLATAQSAKRTGEIGIRKVIGATKKQVFFQFISESSLITLVSIIVSVALAIFMIPYFNQVTGKQFTSSTVMNPLVIIIVAGLAVLFSFFSGFYPAVILSGRGIIQSLKKGFSFTSGNPWLRKGLIVIQFAISVFLIIFTVIILKQMNYLNQKDLGYDKDHVLILPIRGEMAKNFDNLKAAFLQVPGVQSITAAYSTIENIEWGDGITVTGKNGKQEISLNALPAGLDFTKTMKIDVLAGRDFLKSDYSMMDTSNDNAHYAQPLLINETLAKKIGWTPGEAVGKTIDYHGRSPVVGVVKDFNFASLHDPIGPLVIFLTNEWRRYFLLRLNGRNIQKTIASIGTVWKDRISAQPFSYQFLDDKYDQLYAADQKTSSLLTIAASLAIFLACLGLFGLAAFSVTQKTKEIGIRKVLGATPRKIVMLVCSGFLELVVISIVIGFPLAWLLGNKWLEGFAFRVQIGVWIFLVTAAATLLIAFITMSAQALRAATSNPVKAIRTE